MRLYGLIFICLITLIQGSANEIPHLSPKEVQENKIPLIKELAWGGPYFKLELGIGRPELKTKNLLINEKDPSALDYVIVSPRIIGWDFVCNKNLVIGYELGFIFGGRADPG